MNESPHGGYAAVNGLNMFYEIHGSGQPLVLLHGAYMTNEGWGALLPSLAETRQVTTVEQQGHGHTADIDRPLTYEQMADDTAALIRHLRIEPADILGYSMGAIAALQVAIRHPQVVRKLVFVSAVFDNAGYVPGVLDAVLSITPELFVGSPLHDAYLRVAPDPNAFPTLVAKIKQLDQEFRGCAPEDIRKLAAPTLAIFGDSDGTRPEHAIELFKLLGGGVMGDLTGLPKSQLAVLPGTTHFIPPGSGVLDRADWLLPMITGFLDAPMPGA